MLFLLSLLVWGGASAERFYSNLVEDCIPSTQYRRDFRFYPETFQLVGDLVEGGTEVEVAEDFRVRYGMNFKHVQNLRVNETYVLYQCGTTPPDLAGLDPSVKLFEIPLTNVALADVTSSSFLAELGVGDRVKFASGFATDPCLQKISHKCGLEAQDPSSSFANARLLELQTRRADAVFVSAATNDSTTIAFTATSDPAVLKRAEWVKFVSLFFNKEPEANRFFDDVAEEWKNAAIASNADGPRVAWISFQDYAGDEFFLHFAPYKVEYIVAAGGRVLNEKRLKRTSGITSTLNGYLIEFNATTREDAVALLHSVLSNVEIVIDETYQPNNTAYDLQAFYDTFGIGRKQRRELPFAKTGKIFRLDGTVGYSTVGTDSQDWYETGVARPDLVLKDLQEAFGTRKRRRHERTWLRDLAEGELPKRLTHKDCTSFRWCRAPPKPICPSVLLTCVGDLEYRNSNDTVCEPLLCD